MEPCPKCKSNELTVNSKQPRNNRCWFVVCKCGFAGPPVWNDELHYTFAAEAGAIAIMRWDTSIKDRRIAELEERNMELVSAIQNIMQEISFFWQNDLHNVTPGQVTKSVYSIAKDVIAQDVDSLLRTGKSRILEANNGPSND